MREREKKNHALGPVLLEFDFLIYHLCLPICRVWLQLLSFLLIELYQRVPNLIGGSFLESQSTELIDVVNPVSE